jgi:hypothetical protein
MGESASPTFQRQELELRRGCSAVLSKALAPFDQTMLEEMLV